MCVGTGDGRASELCVTEIGRYGATSVQVTRRLRAVLEELRASIRPEHHGAVEVELCKLDASVAERASRRPGACGGGDR
jgi:hypothetical protein